MADEDYTQKLDSLQRYIPFLLNMMSELRAKGNREAQLTKIQSLHDMITNTKKKLKIETLNRCEEVLNNIYYKVNPQLREKGIESADRNLPGIESPRSTPQSPSPPRDLSPAKPITIPTEKVHPRVTYPGCPSTPSTSTRPKVDVYSNVVINPSSRPKSPVITTKVPDMSKPPISLDDLKTLEDDVQQKITDSDFVTHSVDELQKVKKQLQLQLRLEQMNESEEVKSGGLLTNPPNEAIHFKGPKKGKSGSKDKKEEKKRRDSSGGKSEKKEPDLFGNLLCSIDGQLIEEKKKKKKERRLSKEGNKEASLNSDDKKEKKSGDKDKSRSSSHSGDKKKDKHRDKSKSRSEKKSNKKKSKEKKEDVEKEKQEAEALQQKLANVIEHKVSDFFKGLESSTDTSKTVPAEPTNTEIETTKTDQIEPVGPLKRLADKYNPKPKPKPVESKDAEVDKSVSESIEKFMKISPTKPMPNTLLSAKIAPENPPKEPVIIPPEPSSPVQLPEILQKFFSKPLLGDLIPKHVTEPIVRPKTDPRSANRPPPINALTKPAVDRLSTLNPLTKPGAIIQAEPPVLSPPHKPVQFQPPRFLSPPRDPEFISDVIRRPINPNPGILGTAAGLVPLPNRVPAFSGYNDHSIGFGPSTPRVDFDTPPTPRMDFESPSVHFEPPVYPSNEQFGLPRFVPSEISSNFSHFVPPSGPRMEMNHFNNSFDVNPYHAPMNDIHRSQYNVPNQGYYHPERPRWGRDRRPGDPRNYKEYKEMKEQQERAAQEALRKDPRLASRDPTPDAPSRDPRLSRDNDSASDQPEGNKDPRLSRGRDKSVDRTLSRDRARSRTGEQGRETSKSRKNETSKFDKIYSRTNRGRSRSRSEEKESAEDDTFMSPLDSLYNADKNKTGRGYGFQNFKIPRKSRIDEAKRQKEDDVKPSAAGRRNIIDDSSSSDEGDTVFANDSMAISDDEEQETKKPKVKLDTSRIKVVINKESNVWGSYADLKSPTEEEFVSEYDKEVQKEAVESKLELVEKERILTVEDLEVIEVEEPSSSQEVEEIVSSNKQPEIVVSETQNVEAKTAEPEPSEQKILAHFFENLLKSNNKKDKKTALFSLIQTFSDTFDDKEIKKIKKIIKVNEEDAEGNSEDDKESNVAETVDEVSSQTEPQEQQPVVGSTTEEDPSLEKSVESTLPEPVSTVQDTQVNEVTKSTDMPEAPAETTENTDSERDDLVIAEDHVAQSDESLKIDDKEEEPVAKSLNALEPIMVSVGERIKNRKRVPTVHRSKKHKTELDLLQEDIKDMFIRDGVLTATGKRMCRILKDDPNVLQSGKPETPPVSPVPPEPPAEKKVRKKPGPKPKSRASRDFDNGTLKDMRVVINKIPDSAFISSSSLRSHKGKETRDVVEPEDEEKQSMDFSSQSFSDSSEDESELEDVTGSDSDDDSETVKSTSQPTRKKVKKRRGAKWASGVITKPKKKKPKDGASKDRSFERPSSVATSKLSEATEASDNESLNELDESNKLVEPDKEYYYDFANKRKLSCKLCKYQGHMMTGHYLREHPQSEVLCARFAPDVARAAIKDFAENGKKYESIVIPRVSVKYKYTCRMCMYSSTVTPIFFYEHVTTHTGEWRHQCGICEFFAATGKTMSGHFQTAHPGEERKAIRRTYTSGVIFAYVCGECNFIQLNEKNVEDHANIFHLGEKPLIYKVTMSLLLDPELEKLVDLTRAVEPAKAETPKRKKPGPKSKTVKPVTEITATDTPENVVSAKKRPGPKSRTLSPEKEPEEEPAAPSSPPTPVRRKVARAKPKPKAKPKSARVIPDDTSTDEEESVAPKSRKSKIRSNSESDSPAKQTPLTRRTRDLANLLNEDSGDDLDTIITLSSRSSRAAKEKATEKLKNLMENGDAIYRRKPDVESPKKVPIAEAKVPEKPIEPVEPSVEPVVSDTEDNSEQVQPADESSEQEEEEENEKEPSPPKAGHMDPPAISEQSSQNEDNLSAFTSKSDFLQEARMIEEERLRTMDELNKSIGSRAPKLDFINKLSTRLNNEQEQKELISEELVTVKSEPEDKDTEEQQVEKPAIIRDATVVSSPMPSKKPVLDTIPEVQQPNIVFPQNKTNSLISNMIEKLQGKLRQDDDPSPAQPKIRETPNDSDPFVFVGGLVKATKTGQDIFYSCHVNGCCVATKDTTVFQLHCKFGHKDLNLPSALCDKCGIEITTTPDTTLPENLYDHLIFAHSDFLAKPTLRMRRLSGDKLSIKQEKEDTAAKAPEPVEQDVEEALPSHLVITSAHLTAVPESEAMEIEPEEEPPASECNLELAEENPSWFKISSVMSLAESPVSSKEPVKNELKLPPLKLAPQLTLPCSPSKQPQGHKAELLIKEVLMSQVEAKKARKAAKSLQKLLENPSDLYKCPHFFCSFSTGICEMLRRHMQAHQIDPKSLVACVYCDVKTSWEHVPLHIDIRHSACKFCCSYCLYRALLKEYVYLHIEQCHRDQEFVAITLPVGKATKFSIAEENGDHRALCPPYQCSCTQNSLFHKDGNKSITSYLFENEFLRHMEKCHPSQALMCGYKGCFQTVPSGPTMITHWTTAHGIATYQCGICTQSSHDLNVLYFHFAFKHPCSMPSILVRRNYFLPKTHEVRYTDEAFACLVRVVKLPENLSMMIGKRNEKNVKLVKGKGPQYADPEKHPLPLVKGIPGTLALPSKKPSTTPPGQKKSPVTLVPPPSLLLVTTQNNENILLYPVVSPKAGQVHTTTAPINKVPVQTSSASEKILKTTTPPAPKPYRFGNITIYPSDNAGVVLPASGPVTPVSAPAIEEPPVSEEDLLQSAIQSILDHEDETRPATVTRAELQSPPPLAPISNSEQTTPASKSAPEVPPPEHIVLDNSTPGTLAPEVVDPLNLAPEEDFSLIIDEAVDPLADDILNIEPTLTPFVDADKSFGVLEAVSSGDKESIEPLGDGDKAPLKITEMNRSVSVVSNSDEDSDGSSLDKKKRGLMGYQLFRCSACNLSFSSIKAFKVHTTTVCKKSAPKCCHCYRAFKSATRLCEHILTHGVARFTCSLCNEKFTIANIAKLHMKNRHSINQTSLVPLNPEQTDMDIDNFLLKPCQAITPVAKEKENAFESVNKPSAEENSFTPDQIDNVPKRQIFSSNVKCGLCNYQTKVRVNIIRHLQMHLDEKAVSDTAPVNPVPCLEKNEKMFDKMMNFAASSITSRMGEGGKEKEEETFPEFVPIHRRFVCCARGCSYLCLEEGNLKHHIMALHSDEEEFTCAHCKAKIEPEIDDVMKHFKYHALHLYKCHYCNFTHYFKHKVEGHVSSSHLDAVVKLVTLRSMDAEPQDQEDGAPNSNTSQTATSSKFKPWNCCMCKAKYYTKEEIEAHAIKKHNINAQFKCTLCAFKSDTEDACKTHFGERHAGHEFDIIFVYQKLDEEPVKEVVESFDTTPLWQRDKPRVRHIRGILFDESSPQPAKSPKKKKIGASASSGKAVSATITSEEGASTSGVADRSGSENSRKNLFDCIDAVARGSNLLDPNPEPSTNAPVNPVKSTNEIASSPSVEKAQEETASPPKNKESEESELVSDKNKNENESSKTDSDNAIIWDPIDDDVVLIPPKSPNVIVIESDDEEPLSTKSPKKPDSPRAGGSRGLKRPGTTDLLQEALKLAKIEEVEDEDAIIAQGCTRQNLIALYGGIGTPFNKQWKCPKCNQFKSKRVSDFMFHLYKDHKTFRFRCKACTDISITYKYMQAHVDLHPGFTDDIIETLPPNVKLDTWIHMVIREQSLEILKNTQLFKKRPIVGPTDIKCYFCEEKFMMWPDCWEHMLYHWVMMPYQCQDCPSEFYTVYELRHHNKTVHFKTGSDTPKGPTLAKAIQFTENIKKRSGTTGNSPPTLAKKPKFEEKSPPESANSIITLDDDVPIKVSQAAKVPELAKKPHSDEAFACRVCSFVSEVETVTINHIKSHPNYNSKDSKFRYQVLDPSKSEPDMDVAACNVCDVPLPEINLRKHFMKEHPHDKYAPYRFRCDFCNLTYFSAGSLKNHYTRMHNVNRTSFVSIGAHLDKSKKPAYYRHYFCTKCSYSIISSKSMTIKNHLRSHHRDTLSSAEGTLKQNEVVVRVNEEVAADHKEICKSAKIVRSCWEKDGRDAVEGIPSSTVLKQVARKSTSAPHPKPEEPQLVLEEGYSFYGVAPEQFELHKIHTTFEMDDLEYTTTAEQMMKMFNMDTYVDMSDSVMDIMPLDFI